MSKKSAHSLFGTDKNRESGKGVALEYPGFTITIHRAGGSNRKYATTFAEKMKPHRQRFERGLLDEETAARVLRECYAESVVIGWSGDIGPGGKKAAFTPQACAKVFEELPDLFNDVKEQAGALANFRQDQEEVDEKN